MYPPLSLLLIILVLCYRLQDYQNDFFVFFFFFAE
ncbi:hypothetical protein GLYMA_13G183132v4 [Glycine max]|nr:hypothetical protein GLYMA_13G183132v4 [Glycine max]